MKEETAIELMKIAADICNTSLTNKTMPVPRGAGKKPIENFHVCLSEVHKAYLGLTGNNEA